MRCRRKSWIAAWAVLVVAPLVAVSPSAAREVPDLPGPLSALQLEGWTFEAGRTVAYEEHRLFTLAVVEATPAGTEGGAEAPRPTLLRRFLVLKPGTFVIDDVLEAAGQPGRLRYTLSGGSVSEGPDATFRLEAGDVPLAGETLVPKAAAGDWKASSGGIALTVEGAAGKLRAVHVLHRVGEEQSAPDPRTELRLQENELHLAIRSGDRQFRLVLPPATAGAGEIAVSTGADEGLLPQRPLASGVLPFTAEGQRLLERWDGAYRDGRRPGWDVGRPATELKRAVADGEIRPARAVVLGCGTGTNAIYLAGQGFDVTGIDIAPTALARAEKKAGEADVKVRWLVTDVLAPPKLEPFDVVFDRGCYHGVRRVDAAGYVATLRKLTRPGSRVLILAGNANEPRHYGPPRVKEEELRGDFSADFKFVRLRETRFDTRTEGAEGPWAWSVLLERK